MTITYKNKNYELNLEKTKEGYKFSTDGLETDAEILEINENCLLIRHSGEKFICYIAEDENSYYLSVEGQIYQFNKVKDEENYWDTQEQSTLDRQVVRPPMPGNIVKIMVEKGQAVREGDPLLIIEAMKMETTIYASLDGVVKEINTQQGEQVDADKILMIVEKESQE